MDLKEASDYFLLHSVNFVEEQLESIFHRWAMITLKQQLILVYSLTNSGLFPNLIPYGLEYYEGKSKLFCPIHNTLSK